MASLNVPFEPFRLSSVPYVVFKGSTLVTDIDEGPMPVCRAASGSLTLYTPKNGGF